MMRATPKQDAAELANMMQDAVEPAIPKRDAAELASKLIALEQQ